MPRALDLDSKFIDTCFGQDYAPPIITVSIHISLL